MFLASSRSLAGEELAFIQKFSKITERHFVHPCLPYVPTSCLQGSGTFDAPASNPGRERSHPPSLTLGNSEWKTKVLYISKHWRRKWLFNHLHYKTDAGIYQSVCARMCVCVWTVQELENGASILPSLALKLYGGQIQSLLFPDLFNINYFSVVCI